MFKQKGKLTKRAPDAGESGAIPSLFLRLSIFPVGRRSAARPSAGNANRWHAPCIKEQNHHIYFNKRSNKMSQEQPKVNVSDLIGLGSEVDQFQDMFPGLGNYV